MDGTISRKISTVNAGNVGYNKPKLFCMTPSRKKEANTIGRGSKTGIARAVLEDLIFCHNVLKGITD